MSSYLLTLTTHSRSIRVDKLNEVPQQAMMLALILFQAILRRHA
ncbi:MAG: hypothetical protein AAGA75_05905 [Cyanobacteria bacterium P01_E01_bin.6]